MPFALHLDAWLNVSILPWLAQMANMDSTVPANGTVIVTLKSSIATDLKDFNINHTIM